jgi:phage-related protein
MANVAMHLFREADGDVPFLEWLEALPERAKYKCRVRLQRLKEMGNELRRPEADYLQDGVYELRFKHQRVNYRVLYFFHGRSVVVLSHGLQKEKAVPPKEIDRAVARMNCFASDPELHSAGEYIP